MGKPTTSDPRQSAPEEREGSFALQKGHPDDKARLWADENAEAIRDYNRRIRHRGVFSDGSRTW